MKIFFFYSLLLTIASNYLLHTSMVFPLSLSSNFSPMQAITFNPAFKALAVFPATTFFHFNHIY